MKFSSEFLSSRKRCIPKKKNLFHLRYKNVWERKRREKLTFFWNSWEGRKEREADVRNRFPLASFDFFSSSSSYTGQRLQFELLLSPLLLLGESSPLLGSPIKLLLSQHLSAGLWAEPVLVSSPHPPWPGVVWDPRRIKSRFGKTNCVKEKFKSSKHILTQGGKKVNLLHSMGRRKRKDFFVCCSFQKQRKFFSCRNSGRQQRQVNFSQLR